MFKRSNKITALIAAATAVVSIVPVSAAERLGNKEGNITTGVAFDGGYFFNGYRTDDDDAALYYNDGDKDKNVDKDENYDNYSLAKYGEKYAMIEDGSDEYLVDLKTGKIDEDETVEDKTTNAENKLKTKLNKADRYKNTENTNDIKFGRALQGKYGEVWYKYSALGDGDIADRRTTTTSAVTLANVTDLKDNSNNDAAVSDDEYIGFSNDSGNYIDVSQTANMSIFVPAKNDTVKFDEYGDENYGTTLKLADIDLVDQDKDYLYAIATVVAETNGNKSTQYFFQKISKAQGDKKDEAYLPKSVTSYQLDNKSIFDDGDMETAYEVLVEGKDGDGRNIDNVKVNGNNVYVTVKDNNKVKVWTLKLKKDKIDTYKVDTDGNKTTGKNSKTDAYVVMKDTDTDHDIVNGAVAYDVEGNTWGLDEGLIFKFDVDKFKDMYKCDRSLDKLDVYDDNNLIAWDYNDDVYTTVSEGKEVTAEDGGQVIKEPAVQEQVKAGWEKNSDGTWSFYENGVKKIGWVNNNGTWYYIKADGIMATGWIKDGTVWYYLQSDGAMKTGWLNDNGTWYYLNASGTMVTGWFQDSDGSWYFFSASGAMLADTTVDGYVLGSNGAWIK